MGFQKIGRGLALVLALCLFCAYPCLADQENEEALPTMAPDKRFPAEIYTGEWDGGHIQGIAVDQANGFIYYSFTTQLVKSDLAGNIIGSVKGLMGHLGCLDFNEGDGRVYGSLEYKNDAIGQGILNRLGAENPVEDGFYIAVFDVDRIVRRDMDAESDGIMTAVYLKDVVEDYLASWEENGRTMEHRYGCSGIDGLAFGPQFGQGPDTPYYLNVAYGVYSDLERTDNDYQVILQYDISDWDQYKKPLNQSSMHKNGPETFRNRFFVFTGNTNWGVQNLEYDEASGNWLMCVYRGKKPQYPNRPLYVIDGGKAPVTKALRGFSNGETGQVLTLLADGAYDEKAQVYGWEFAYGSTGIASLGNGLFYVSLEGKNGGLYHSSIRLYRWTGDKPDPFRPAD